MSTYEVRAVRWKHGWELHVDGVGVTQVRTLAAAEQQVRDFVETMLEIDAEDAEISILPELDGLEIEIERTKEKAAEAARLQVEAATETRAEAQAMRDHGLSVSDIAVVMRVSRGRASQLLADTAVPDATCSVGGAVVSMKHGTVSRAAQAADR